MLFVRLKASNIDRAFTGALGYAVDITLLAPSAFSLRQMLDICSQYAFEFCISFSASKSKCIVFRHSGDNIDDNRYSFYISDQCIEMVEQWSHLGNIIDNSQQDKDCILFRRNKMIGQINDTLCSFRNLYPLVKNELLYTYCSSLYGSVLWSINNSEIQRVCSAWRSAIKRVWGFHYRSHNRLIS